MVWKRRRFGLSDIPLPGKRLATAATACRCSEHPCCMCWFSEAIREAHEPLMPSFEDLFFGWDQDNTVVGQ